MTITEFLTARYDEDERFTYNPALMPVSGPGLSDLVKRARADIAAKRAIVALAGRATEADRRMLAAEGATDPGPPYIGDPFLWALAQPFAEHADFDPAWRVA